MRCLPCLPAPISITYMYGTEFYLHLLLLVSSGRRGLLEFLFLSEAKRDLFIPLTCTFCRYIDHNLYNHLSTSNQLLLSLFTFVWPSVIWEFLVEIWVASSQKPVCECLFTLCLIFLSQSSLQREGGWVFFNQRLPQSQIKYFFTLISK